MKTPPSTNNMKNEEPLDLDFHIFKDFEEMENRLTKTLYYGKAIPMETPSLALSNIAVELFVKSTPQQLDQIDVHYIDHVSRNMCLSSCSVMLAMVYLERLQQYNPHYIQSMSSSKLFLVSMMVASKFLYDIGDWNENLDVEWAEAANLDIAELRKMELEFLTALDWRVFVNFDMFEDLLHQIESEVAIHEGLKRGWFSYTDLEVLSKNLNRKECLSLLLDSILKVTVVCAIAYTAGVLTLVGSSYIVGMLPLHSSGWKIMNNDLDVGLLPTVNNPHHLDSSSDNTTSFALPESLSCSSRSSCVDSSETCSPLDSALTTTNLRLNSCCRHCSADPDLTVSPTIVSELASRILVAFGELLLLNNSLFLDNDDYSRKKEYLFSPTPVISTNTLDFQEQQQQNVALLSECLQSSLKMYQVYRTLENHTDFPFCNSVPVIVS